MRIPDVTIVIPVHGRQWTLNRCLSYLERFDGPVIVADSSPAPFADIGGFPRVDYRHMPGMPYFEKLKAVYASVQTPFLIDVPDDDFVVLSGLAACCDHLRANPDVGLCGGHILVFKDAKDGIALDLIHTGASLAAQIAATASGQALPPADRILHLFENPVDIVHAVMRREVALSPHEIIDRHPDLSPIRFFGRLWWFTAATVAGMAFLDTLLLMRARNERLINAPAYPAALQRDVPHTAILSRLGPDGGAFTDYLVAKAGLSREDARAAVARMLEYWMTGVAPDVLERRRRETLPLVEAAATRQAADVALITGLIRAYPAPPSPVA